MGLLGSVLLLGFVVAVLNIIAVGFCVSAVLDNLDASKAHSRQHDGHGTLPERVLKSPSSPQLHSVQGTALNRSGNGPQRGSPGALGNISTVARVGADAGYGRRQL
jgi:hypothetical protein